MDPLSIATSLIDVIDRALQITSALVDCAREIENASADRAILVKDTLFLSKILQRETRLLSEPLQRLRDQPISAPYDETWLAEYRDNVRRFKTAYDDLAMTLKIDVVTGKIREESKTTLRAAHTTAKWSFCKSEIYNLLERITRLQQYAKALLVHEQHTLLEGINQKQQEALDQRLRTSVLNWLSPLPVSQIHQLFSEQAVKGSGKWLLTDPAFERWKDGDGTRLWCWGTSGAGKTVMASIIINHLRQSRPEELKDRIGITFIYLRYNEADQTFENVLSSLLKQFIEDSGNIPPALLSLYERHRDRKTSPTTDEISQALYTTIGSHKEVFCIIDALDECNEDLRLELVKKLENLGPKLRVLIMSQDMIADELEHYQRLEIRANKADIELFIEHQIRTTKNLRKTIDKSPSLNYDIKRGVVDRAESIFLLARLHVESLAIAAGLSVRHIRNKLRKLPETLLGAYDDVVERIDNQEPDRKRIALKALAWVCHASRALSLKELQHAIAVDIGDTVLDEDLLMDGQSITSLCAGLLVVDQRTKVVNLVHYSTKSYLGGIRLPEFDAEITLLCATYLTLGSLKGANIWEIVQDYPLACYAAQFMGEHARNSPQGSFEPPILDMICNLLSHPDERKPLLSLLDGLDLIQVGFYSKAKPMARENTKALVDAYCETEIPALLDSVLEIERSDTSCMIGSPAITASDTDILIGNRAKDDEIWETKIRTSEIPELTALQLTASIGLAKSAALLLKGTTNIDAVNRTGKTTLALALERGFEKAVEILLNSGACVDLQREHGRGVLLLMTERGWYNAGNIIIENARLAAKEEAPGQAQDRIYFLVAAYEGNIKELTLDAQQLKSRDGDIGVAALFLAVEKGFVQMVEALLSLGIDINSKDILGQTALHRATRRKDEKMIRLLLKSGADVECEDDDNRTPWSANLRCNNPDILQILLNAGANPSTRGQQGVSELYTAAKDGDTPIVKYMLKSGTHPSIQTHYGWAPLHWAASNGHVDCVKLLLEAGANPNTVSDQRVTPLDLATQAEQKTVIEVLHQAGAKLYEDFEAATKHKVNELESYREWHSTNRRDRDNTSVISLDEGKIGPDAEKLRLCYDKPLARTLLNPTAVGRYVYPSGTTGAVNNIYEVSHFLESTSASINVRRSKTRAQMWEYTQSESHFDVNGMLYAVVKMKADYSEFELCGRRKQDPFTGPIIMQKDWTGGWTVRHNVESNSKAYLLRTIPELSKNKEEISRWMLDDDTLQARSGWNDATPWICIELGVDRQMQDVIVTCWVAKLWAETAGLQK